jgi:hypothetical protein
LDGEANVSEWNNYFLFEKHFSPTGRARSDFPFLKKREAASVQRHAPRMLQKTASE